MIKSILKRILVFIVNNPLVAVGITVVATVLFILPIPKVDFSASSDSLMVKDNPDQVYFNQVKDIFGDDQISVICLISDRGIYRKDVFDTLQGMTSQLENIKGVKEVVSLTNIRNITGKEVIADDISYNELDTGQLVKEIPSTTQEWQELRKRAESNPLYLKNIVSADGKATSVNVILETMPEEELYNRDIVGQIEKIIEQARRPGLDISVTGISQTKVETSKYLKEDLKKFLPYTVIFIAIALYINFYQGTRRFNAALIATIAVSVTGFFLQTYSSFSLPFETMLLGTAAIILFLAFFGGHAIILPLLAVILSVVWAVGFMGYIGMKFSLVNTVMPSLLITIGIADVIHVMSEYYHESHGKDDEKQALVEAVSHVAMPVFVTSLTTSLAFGSLVTSPIPAIRDMGILAVFGVIVALTLSLTFIPAMVVLTRHKPKDVVEEVIEVRDEKEGEDWISRMLRQIGDWDLRHAAWILVAIGALNAGMIPGITMLEVDTDFMSYFHKDDPIIQARDKLVTHLAGSAPFFLVVDGHLPDAFLDPRMLKKIEDFEKWLSRQEGVDLAISVVSYLKLTNKAQWGNDPSHYEIPDNRKAVAQLYQSLSSTNMLDPYINKDMSMANVMIRTRVVGSTATLALEDKIKQWTEKNFPEAKVTMTGTLYLLNKTADNVSRNQTWSTLLETFTIFLVMSLLLLSFKMGFLSMIPNVFPIIIMYGVMGYFGITINLSTCIIANILIGLAVDDTIHLLTEFNQKIKKLRDEKESIRATLAATGRPVSLTAVTLLVGFAVVSFSKFAPVAEFGILTTFTLLICPMGDLFMLPSILRYTKIITLWDVLDVKLGKDPKKKIKIFEGLSNRQARIAALMGHIQPYKRGDGIIEEGDVGSEMFVVITGKVEIYSGDYAERMSIAILGPGDNFGEMAVVRHGFRSASALALDTTELLIMDEGTLNRIKRRYPRIAAAIFLNLTRILSDRLQITTVTAMLRGK